MLPVYQAFNYNLAPSILKDSPISEELIREYRRFKLSTLTKTYILFVHSSIEMGSLRGQLLDDLTAEVQKLAL